MSNEPLMFRQIVIGKNSKIWSVLSHMKGFASVISISHTDVGVFDFRANDRVWILSYSRVPEENRSILLRLRDVGVTETIYVSSSSTNVTSITNCYEYPRIKKLAENEAIRLCNARILVIGLFYENNDTLPAGNSVVTSANQLAEFMRSSILPEQGSTTLLFQPIKRTFNTLFEYFMYRLYGSLLYVCGPVPCLLRPVDFVLRSMGYNWYGYFYLSNKLWFMTI